MTDTGLQTVFSTAFARRQIQISARGQRLKRYKKWNVNRLYVLIYKLTKLKDGLVRAEQSTIYAGRPVTSV